MANLIEKGIGILDNVFRKRKEASFDPDLILQEITSTEEMRYYT